MSNGFFSRIRRHITPFSMLMMFLWTYNSLVYFINIFLSGIGGISQYFTTVLFIVLLLASAKEIKKRIKVEDIVFYIFIVLVYLLQFLLYPENTSVLENYAVSFLLTVVPFFFFGLFLNINEFKEPFFWLSLLSVFVQGLYQLWYRPLTGNYLTSEDMVGAYQIVMHVCFTFMMAFEKKRLLYYVLAILSLIFLLSLGNRGTLVCVILFLVYCLIFVAFSKRSPFLKISTFSISALILIYYDKIASVLAVLFGNFNMSIRILSKLKESEFGTSESREWITNTLMKAVDDGPIFGYGIGGDRGISGILFAHNVIIEILVHFGYVLGGLILFSIFFLIVKAFVKTIDREDRLFLALLLSCSFSLLVSGTYLESSLFWLLIGYSKKVAVSPKKKQTIQTNVIHG